MRRLASLLLLLLLALPTPAVAAWAFVLGNSETSSDGILAYTSNVTANNLLIVLIGHATNSTATVVDTQLNTWASAVNFYSVGNDYSGQILFAVAGSTGANTVTVTVIGGGNELTIAEYSGNATASPLDQTASAEGTSTAAASSSAVTTTDGQLILGGILSSGAITAAGGSVVDVGLTGVPVNTALTSKTQVSAGSINTTATIAPSSAWLALMATFKAVAAGGSVAPQRGLMGVGQ